jgi:uncharacterized protein YndB with AHSA1/START domain
MKSNLSFNFTVDKEAKTVNIIREFDANVNLVWKAFTTAELLDQWWAPKPYHVETKTLDFKVGGIWLYAMVSPQNEKMWCKADYKAIETNELLSWLDAFCDENGVENTIKPRSLWTNNFIEKDGITTVKISLKHESLEDIEMMIKMGFKEGFTMAVGNLDDLLSTLKK